jgi:hypothetical protein
LRSFDRDINSNLVTVFEAVGHGFRRAVNAHSDSLDFRLFDVLGKGSAREPYHSKGRRLHGRFAGLVVDRNPHLVWVLRGQAMKTECGEQTNNAPRNAFGCHGETVVFRDRRLRKGVDAACLANEETSPVQAQQEFSGDSQCLDIARTNQRRPANESWISWRIGRIWWTLDEKAQRRDVPRPLHHHHERRARRRRRDSRTRARPYTGLEPARDSR